MTGFLPEVDQLLSSFTVFAWFCPKGGENLIMSVCVKRSLSELRVSNKGIGVYHLPKPILIAYVCVRKPSASSKNLRTTPPRTEKEDSTAEKETDKS